MDVGLIRKCLGVGAVVGAGLAAPTFHSVYTIGLQIVEGALLVLTVLQLTDKGESNMISLIPNFIFIGFLLWYIKICYTHKDAIREGEMPDNWQTFAWIICGLMVAHVVILLVGGAVACGTWLTSAFMVVFVAMQHIVAENFMTNG
jgi:hypothetical protein